MVHSLTTTGDFKIRAMVRRNGLNILGDRPGQLNELRGMLGFINSIDDLHKCSEKEKLPKKKTYRRFLMYSTFYAAPTPVILCEGKTDNVYLTHAIRALAVEFPDLAIVVSNKETRLKVRLYRYAKTSTGNILNLGDGGSGSLSRFYWTIQGRDEGFH